MAIKPGLLVATLAVLTAGVRTWKAGALAKSPRWSGFLPSNGAAWALASLVAAREMSLWRSRHENEPRLDRLTRLPSRTEFERLLANTIARARSLGLSAAVIYIDLDGFTQVNELHGRHTGDVILAKMAAALRASIDQEYLLARIGGDEFAAVMPQIDDRSNVAALADRILRSVRDAAEIHSPGIPITASIGASIFPDHSSEPATLVRMADIAMYQSKSRSGDCFLFFDNSMNRVDFASTGTVAMLRTALQRDRLRVLYQPIVNARGGPVVFEALVRIDDPEAGLLGPAQFIPVAEQTGLIHDIGRAVLRTACRQVRAWRNAGFHAQVAVNVSAVELESRSLASEICSIAEEEQAPASAVCIEMTETAVTRDAATTKENLLRLRKAGFPISLDDFGTGYSSLNMLHWLPIDHLKIDRSFTDKIAADRRMALVVGRTVQLAHELGLQVTAEGIERAEQFEIARQIGCDFFQGFLFAKPLSAPQATEMLKREATRSDLLRLEDALAKGEPERIDSSACDARDLEEIQPPV